MKAQAKDLEQGAMLTTAAIAAGEDRVKWMRSALCADAIASSWRITMDFNPQGDLLSYWECSLDDDNNELTGGGISQIQTPGVSGTKSRRGLRFSTMQIQALLAGVNYKFARSCLGWWSDDDRSFFRPATIKSLHKRGLLDANFTDMRVHDGNSKGVQNLDRAVHEHSLESPKRLKFQVWTSYLGRQLLREMGLVPDDGQMLH